MQRFEHVVVRLDAGAAGAVLRMGLGYLIGRAWLQLIGMRGDEWTVAPFFVAVLIALRVVPALVRKVGRFSEPVRTIWSERRQTAKRYDSYQWQKLFWIGLGLTLSVAFSERRSMALGALASFCVIAGTLGLVTWRMGGHDPDSGAPTVNRTSTSEQGAVPTVFKLESKA